MCATGSSPAAHSAALDSNSVLVRTLLNGKEGLDEVISKIEICAIAVLAVAGFGQTIAARADGLDPIAIRQVGMDLANSDFAFIRSVVAAKGDVKPLEASGKALARWGGTTPAC